MESVINTSRNVANYSAELAAAEAFSRRFKDGS
jgi:hypothetical protein